MDTLKVVQYPGGYLGVYHCFRHRRFEVRVATSTDLRKWTFRRALDAHASQPTLARTPLGGYVLAEEGDNSARSGPGRRFLRFRYYASTVQLLGGQAQRTFVAPHTLAAPRRGAEGTPSIYNVALRPDIAHSRIEVGLHYSADGVDHEAGGSLVDFHTWTAHPDHAFDRALRTIGMRGKHGDRDAIATTAGEFILVECQDGSDDIWRLAWYDPRRGSARMLSVHTPGASRSVANPTLTYVHLPDGAAGVVVTMFVPHTGAGRGESGELVYRRRLPASSPTGRTP